MELYKRVTGYQELIDLNIKFINGEIDWTPYHQKPIENTGPLKHQLIEINRLGFLTLGGQCALDTPQEEKKLFLDGYLDSKMVRNFIKYLKGYKKIEFFIEFPDKSIKTNIRNWHNKYNTKENQTVYFNSLARTRNGAEWVDTDILPFRDLSYITFNFWRGYPNILNILKDYCFVHIQHRSFHNLNNDLYTILLGYLKSDKSSYKPKRQKNNFGNINLKQLKQDLELVKLTSRFGNKKFYEPEQEFYEPRQDLYESRPVYQVKPKRSFFKEVGSHINKNKWTYIDAATKIAVLALLKNYWNKSKKKRIKEENKEKDKLIREIHAKVHEK